MIAPSIFRSYDVRGVVDVDLTEAAVERIGLAFAALAAQAGQRRLTVGRDCRAHSERLFAALARGLTAGGADVLDVGLVPTPIQYFSIHHLGAGGGVMITGSHNPPEDNGLKLTLAGESLAGARIQAVRALCEGALSAPGGGAVTRVDVVAAYEDTVVAATRPMVRPLSVVVDAGNGTAGPFAPRVLRRWGAQAHELYCDLDPRFPHHHPDPSVEANLRALREAVLERRADVGLAFDGDGDRLGVIDERGQVWWGDRLTLLFARAVLAERPGATVVSEVKCSQLLYDDVAARGGVGVMWKAGHSHIKQKMRELGAALGGEMSGHLFFADRYLGYDDATYAALRLLELVSAADRPLSALLDDLPPTASTPELRVRCPEPLKQPLVDALIARLRAAGHRVSDVDGARVTVDGGWGLVRCSHTGPMLILRFEADTEARLAEVRAWLEGELAAARAALEA